LLLIVMLPAHLTVVAQQTGGVDNFSIYISADGENQTSGNLTLGPVTLGDTVIITFIWNDTNNPWNNHQMEIDGYNLTTDVLSQQTPMSVIQFTADLVGSFRIHCIIPCLGMDNMQNGWLVVVPATSQSTASSSSTTSATGSSSASGIISTTSTITTVSSNSTVTVTNSGATISNNSTVTTAEISSTTAGTVTTSNSNTISTLITTTSTSKSKTTSGVIGTELNMLSMNANSSELLASVRLSESNGTPIASAQVQFSIPTDFGKMSIGSKTTDNNGTAYLAYQLPSQWEGLLYASYAGSKSYGSSNVTGAVYPLSVYIPSNPASSPAEPPYVSGQGNSIDFRLIGVPAVPDAIVMGVFVSVLVSVYGVMMFALANVLRIKKRSATKG